VTIIEGGGICDICECPSTDVVYFDGELAAIACKDCITAAARLLGIALSCEPEPLDTELLWAFGDPTKEGQ